MLAILFQAGVIQTHNHLASTIVSASDQLIDNDTTIVSGKAGAAVTDKSRPTAPRNCPLCEDQALFGSYVLAAPAVIVAPLATRAWYVPELFFATIARQASHAWRSRAPPIA